MTFVDRRPDWLYFKSLASTLAGRITSGVRRIVITSSGPQEGKSTIAANLGRALAGSRTDRVLLVDTDWRNPTLHKIFGLNGSPGLGDVLKEIQQVEPDIVSPNHMMQGDWVGQIDAQERTGRALVTEKGQEFSVLFRKGKVSGFCWRKQPSAKEVAGLMSYLFPNGSVATTPEAGHSRGTNGRQPSASRFEDASMGPPVLTRLEKVLKDSGVTNLKVLPCGPEPVDLQDSSTLDRFRKLLDRLAGAFQVILIDAPPVNLLSPTAALAGLADGVLLVVKSDGLDVQVIQEAKDELVNANANLLGVVLNQVNLSKNGGRKYYYGVYAR